MSCSRPHVQEFNAPRIPAKFATKHGSDLSDSVRLKVPNGFVWEVKLHRTDKDILMQDGWAEFMEYYRIDHGSFVVFKYEGGSQFRVVIFDLTACEIDYPVDTVVHTLADQPSPVPEREKPIEKEDPIILSSNDRDDVQLLDNHKIRKHLCFPRSTVVKIVSGLRAANFLSDDVQLLDNHKIRKHLRCPRSTVVKIVSGLRAANYLSEVKVHAMGEELDVARASGNKK